MRQSARFPFLPVAGRSRAAFVLGCRAPRRHTSRRVPPRTAWNSPAVHSADDHDHEPPPPGGAAEDLLLNSASSRIEGGSGAAHFGARGGSRGRGGAGGLRTSKACEGRRPLAERDSRGRSGLNLGARDLSGLGRAVAGARSTRSTVDNGSSPERKRACRARCRATPRRASTWRSWPKGG